MANYPCDCPNQKDSMGRRCGARSAFDRAGGREPECNDRVTRVLDTAAAIDDRLDLLGRKAFLFRTGLSAGGIKDAALPKGQSKLRPFLDAKKIAGKPISFLIDAKAPRPSRPLLQDLNKALKLPGPFRATGMFLDARDDLKQGQIPIPEPFGIVDATRDFGQGKGSATDAFLRPFEPLASAVTKKVGVANPPLKRLNPLVRDSSLIFDVAEGFEAKGQVKEVVTRQQQKTPTSLGQSLEVLTGNTGPLRGPDAERRFEDDPSLTRLRQNISDIGGRIASGVAGVIDQFSGGFRPQENPLPTVPGFPPAKKPGVPGQRRPIFPDSARDETSNSNSKNNQIDF